MYKPICPRQLGLTVFIIGYYDIVRKYQLSTVIVSTSECAKKKKKKITKWYKLDSNAKHLSSSSRISVKQEHTTKNILH